MAVGSTRRIQNWEEAGGRGGCGAHLGERAGLVLVADEGAGEVELRLPEAFGVEAVGVGRPDAVFVEGLVVAGAEEIVAGEGFVVEGARAEAAYRVRRMTFFM